MPGLDPTKPKLLSLVWTLLVALTATPQFAQAKALKSEDSRLTWVPCWFSGGDNWPESDCGYLTVPETRTISNGRFVKLPLIVFRAPSGQAAQPPVLITGGGGPGNPLRIDPKDPGEINKYLWFNNSYMSIDSGRDLILMDNCGVGSSEPRLDCPEVEKALMRLIGRPTSPKESERQQVEAYGDCKNRFEERGIDLGAYNSFSAAQDIEDLRLALDLSALNLYGVSYGIRIALTYLREFPEGVHAVVLDGVVPPEVDLYEAAPKEAFTSLKAVFDLCSRDEYCRSRYDEDQYGRFIAFLEKLEKNTIYMNLTEPGSLRPIEVMLTPEVLIASIFGAVYSEYMIGVIPRTIEALMNGSSDYAGELVREQILRFMTVDSVDEGAYASYTCYDEAPFNDFSVALSEASAYPLQKYINVPWILTEKAICEEWGMTGTNSVENSPVVSDKPVLLYSGALDPATPPSWARSAARYLVNGRLKEWDGVAHHVLASSVCADSVAAIFLSYPDEDPFYLSCLDEENTIIFQVD